MPKSRIRAKIQKVSDITAVFFEKNEKKAESNNCEVGKKCNTPSLKG